MDTSQPEAVNPALLAILREDLNVDVSRVTRDSRLIDDVGMDSVAFAVGMVAIEDRLGAALDEEDLLNCETLGDLESIVLAKIPADQANS
jgi:acyl carrier protein